MLIGNMVFSTLAGGIADILENDQTGYILRGNLKEDADVFEKIFIQKSQNDMNKINENARRYIEENCDIQKQVLSMKDIILK